MLMQYKIDENLRDFKAWSGGYDTLATLVEKDLVDEAEEFLEELLSDYSPFNNLKTIKS